MRGWCRPTKEQRSRGAGEQGSKGAEVSEWTLLRPSAPPHICLTLRENTERPVTVTQGTNTVVGCDPKRIVTEALAILDGKGKTGRVPELWDGQAAGRIAKALD